MAGIGAGSSVAVALSEACAVLHAHQSCQGDALSCSEGAESEQGFTRCPRMLSGGAACLQAMEGAAARPGVGRAPCACRRRWTKPQVHSPRFSQHVLCRLCVPHNPEEQSGPLRSPGFCPVPWSAAAAPCEGLGSVWFVFLSRGRNQDVPRNTPSIQQVWKQPRMRCKAPK